MSVEPNGKNESEAYETEDSVATHVTGKVSVRRAAGAASPQSPCGAMERNVWQLKIWERHRFCW